MSNDIYPETNKDAILFIDSTEKNMDMFYLTKIFVPDPFILLIKDGRSTAIMGDLEYERAKKEACADCILRSAELKESFKDENSPIPGIIKPLIVYLELENIKSLLVPQTFSIIYADTLRKCGFDIEYKPDPFIPVRTRKSGEEIEHIREVVEVTEQVLSEAIGIIGNSKIIEGNLFYGNEPLTSELLKGFMASELIKKGYLAENTIVSCGRQSFDPHSQGSGQLFADQPIIIDIFPRSMKTFYYADMTRTVMKGNPHPELLKMFNAVKDAQAAGVELIADGVTSGVVHKAVCDVFDEYGFRTGIVDGVLQGFIHSTGHGVGLDIHEEPRIYNISKHLETGEVVTVEPGLYYKDYGGVRIEDLVVVEENGAQNLNKLEKVLVLD